MKKDGEMDRWVRAFAALAEDWDLVLSTRTAAHNLLFSFDPRRSSDLFWLPRALCVHGANTYTQANHSHTKT